MLVLTRKPHQKIMIGDNITITIADIQGDSIRIAIDAPKNIKIFRGEVYAAIQAENKSAAIPSDMIDLKSVLPKTGKQGADEKE